MATFKRPNGRLIARAEAVSERLSRLGEVVERVSWDLDSALSSINKDAAGYRRSNAANRDGGESYIPGELEAALIKAEELNVLLLALDHAA